MLVHVCVPAAWLRLFRQLEEEKGCTAQAEGWQKRYLCTLSSGGIALVMLGVLGWWGLFSQDHCLSQAALSIGHHVGG